MRMSIFIALAASWLAIPLQTQAQTAPTDPVATKVVSFDDIMKWVGQGKDAPTILDSCDTIFTFNFQETEKLRKAGASDALIDALQKKRMKLGDVRNIAIILDCSGSMSDKMPDGKTKMETAKKVVSDLIAAIPAGRNLAFIVYGNDLKLACESVEVKRPLGPLENEDKEKLQKIIAALEPTGHTPIAKSLLVAGMELLNAKGICQVVLITDGEETCKGDPAKVAGQLAMRDNMRAVEVIGLGLTPEEKKSISNIAHRGRGKFYDSQTAKDLEKAVVAAVPVKPPVEVAKKDEPEPLKKEVVKKDEPKVPEPSKKVDVPAELPKSVQRLIAALMSDEDAKTRTTAAEALAAFKTPPSVATVVAALSEALKDKDGRVRRMAADSLAKIGDATAADPLVKRIADEVWNTYPTGGFNFNPNDPPPHDGGGKTWGSKDHALIALKKLAPDKVPEALVAALKGKNDALRAWAAARMGSEKGEAATKALVEALNDKDGQVRRSAADSLSRIGDKSEKVIEALIDRIGDAVWLPRPNSFNFNPDDPPAYDDEKDWGSKYRALQALRKLAPEKIDEALAGAVVSKSPEVKKWAIQMIGKEKGKNP